MAGAEAPEVFPGSGKSVVFNGTEIGDWTGDLEADHEDDVQEFQGSNNTPKAQIPSGTTHGLSFSVGMHATPLTLIETAYYTVPKPVIDVTITYFEGFAKTYRGQVTHLTYGANADDIMVCDVEMSIRSVT